MFVKHWCGQLMRQLKKLNWLPTSSYGMCLVLECITGFFEILTALVLSQYIGMGSSYSTCISIKVCFIQRTCVQHVVVAIYSASVVDKDTDDCFLLSHDTKHSPK
jgi:hypothetical protein